MPLVALYGGTVLYLLGHVVFKWRALRRFRWPRPIAALVLLALIPAVWVLPALATLGIATAVLIALIGYETVAYAEIRQQVRDDEHDD